MKKIFFIIFSLILILTISVIYYKLQNSNLEANFNFTNSLNKGNVNKIDKNVLLKYMYTKKSKDLTYEGGPSHWGSRTKKVDSIVDSFDSKLVTFKVTDNSDLKGEDPPKTWNEIWKLNEGGIYIDEVLAIKLPLELNNEWNISNYVPIVRSDEKYNAKIKVTDISNSINELGSTVQNITTVLTIDDLKMEYNGKYTETTVYETGIGIKSKTVTEPSIKDLNLNYFIL